MSLFSWQFFLSCWLQKMDVESFQLSVTDPIQPLPPKLFFSPTLIFQLWESNFPVTRAENNNKNRECSFNSPLTVPAQTLSSSHWFCVWLLSPSCFPLTLFSSGSHSHFLPICFQSTSIFFFLFFGTIANFVFLCPTALPRPPKEGPLSASPLTPHTEPSQAQTTCLVTAAQNWPSVIITLCYSRNSADPNCLSNQGRLKG